MAFDTTKETMVSFLVPSQILETIEDIRDFEGNPSRSSIIQRLINRGLRVTTILITHKDMQIH